MCGIVGYLGDRSALEVILSGLEKLEYRGYDSAGVALSVNGTVEVTRSIGKLSELKKILAETPPKQMSHLGIGHTRWATHGRPSENNAHPHTAGRVSLIHNGIIENYIDLREKLEDEGAVFSSETDTEIAAHLLNRYLEKGLDSLEALRTTCRDIRGSYAFVAIDRDNPDRLLVAKNATPIVIGLGDKEVFVASDIPALLNYTRRVIILEDGDIAEVHRDQVRIKHLGPDGASVEVKRLEQNITWDPVTAQKGGFKHFMLKEIYEQPQVLADTFRGRVEIEMPRVFFPELTMTDEDIAKVNRVILVACGTAWHACLVGKFYLQALTGIPCEVDYASEFRYRTPVLNDSTLVIAVSQSGETADTLAAIEMAMSHGAQALAVCNVLGSSMARKVPNVIFTHAGPEISVASTKAFTTQLAALYLLAAFMGQKRKSLDEKGVFSLINDLVFLPSLIDDALKTADKVEKVARKFHGARDFLFLGRGICYPIALEGALKLKEISYIHAEGYPAGEMKHGPIALIDESMPVVMVMQRSDVLFEKTLSNLREVESRGGKILAVTDVIGSKELKAVCDSVIEMPFVSELLSPISLTIPLQLLAYYVAVFNGTDVDLPRNLAKSVTVE
ncbi:MAG: glutamine--fructose-6-phosphate transaminase (isomerizing) [Deltaproteobacteria bacterium]|nr:glutamine--fructose-6-phosphate transaminase (isomerizing) [Deltaproteobacteria bacterium]